MATALAWCLLLASCSSGPDAGEAPPADPSDPVAHGCGPLAYDEDAPSGGTFTDYAYLSTASELTSFDPAVVHTLAEPQITLSLWDGLTDFDYSLRCAPVLKGLVAQSWEVNDDATKYVFTLRADAQFSNGEPVLPSNFKAAWERAGSSELDSPYGYLIETIEGGDEVLDGTVPTLDAVLANDEALTLTVPLSAPNAEFSALMSHPFFSPADFGDLDEVGNSTGWGTDGLTVGNGPFVLDSADDEQVTLVRNERWDGNVYGDTEAKLDKLVFRVSADVDQAYARFVSGKGDSGPVPPAELASAVQEYPKNTVGSLALGADYYLFGADDAQLGGDSNRGLRQAISLAIDRGQINDEVYAGTRGVATGIAPPGTPGFSDAICEYCKHDRQAAVEAFDAWQANGGVLAAPIRLGYNNVGTQAQVATIVAANVQDALGITVELAPVDDDYFRVEAAPGGCELCRSGWYGDYPSYANFMVDQFSEAAIGSNNLGRFVSPALERQLANAMGETDDAARAALFNEAERTLLNEEVMAVPLTWYRGSEVFRDDVVNVDVPPLGVILWERVALDR